MNKLKLLILTVMMTAGFLSKATADEMIFVHSPSCVYCQAWREEIMPIYPKTSEGKRLPLREVNLDQGMPDDLKHLAYPSFTPTFIIVDSNQKEVGRILGYNSEFFWGFVQNFIKKIDPAFQS